MLQNSAAVVLGCCKAMMDTNQSFGKGKVRDAILRIASDFLTFDNTLVMRAAAQIFGIVARIEDASFKESITGYLCNKRVKKKHYLFVFFCFFCNKMWVPTSHYAS